MKTISCFLIAVMGVSLLAGCPPKSGTIVNPPERKWDEPLPPGYMGLSEVDPKDIPDFTMACGDIKGLRQAVQYSIDYMARPSSKSAYAKYGPTFTHERALASLKAFADLLDQNLAPDRMNAAIREKFTVYTSVGYRNGSVYTGEVKFTGYYTPIFQASAVQTPKYKYPIYRQPADLQKDADGNMLGQYPTRQELESTQKSRLDGLEMYWLADPFEVYIVQVQGSAKLDLGDRMVTVGYTANNGHEYRPIGPDLVADGKIPSGQLSLRKMIEYFKANPNDVTKYTWKNPRFVFFAEGTGEPRGSLNVPVTPWRSLATDKAIFPRGCVTFLSATMPRESGNLINMVPYTGFALDQDTGGAIRAPGRCDVYMGVGNQAGEMAGRTQEVGRLYYLLVKPSTMGAPSATPAPAAGAPINPAPTGAQ